MQKNQQNLLIPIYAFFTGFYRFATFLPFHKYCWIFCGCCFAYGLFFVWTPSCLAWFIRYFKFMSARDSRFYFLEFIWLLWILLYITTQCMTLLDNLNWSPLNSITCLMLQHSLNLVSSWCQLQYNKKINLFKILILTTIH